MSPERVALIRAVALLTRAQAELRELRLAQTGDDDFEFVNHSAAQIIDDIEAFLMGPAPKLAKGEKIPGFDSQTAS